jgi:hypothetical protein
MNFLKFIRHRTINRMVAEEISTIQQAHREIEDLITELNSEIWMKKYV